MSDNYTNFTKWKRDGFKGETFIVLPTETISDFIENPQVSRMYLTDVGFFPCADHHFRERPMGVDQYIFIYCTEGTGHIFVKGKEYVLHENEAFCIPHGMTHRYYADEKDPWSILWVHFCGTDTIYYPLDECVKVKFDTTYSNNRMHFLFDLLFRVLDGTYTLGNFIYISQVLSLILAETYDREKSNSAQEQNKEVTMVIRYMYKHISESLSLEDIVNEFGLSKSYLNVIFKKYTRHSTMDFFISIKMKRACLLLKSTDRLIYDIAQELGYSDQYYFSRIFRKVVGMSPAQYRKSDIFHYKD